MKGSKHGLKPIDYKPKRTPCLVRYADNYKRLQQETGWASAVVNNNFALLYKGIGN